MFCLFFVLFLLFGADHAAEKNENLCKFAWEIDQFILMMEVAQYRSRFHSIKTKQKTTNEKILTGSREREKKKLNMVASFM